MKAVAVFVVMVLVLIVAPLALVGWNSVSASVPEAPAVEESAPAEPASPADDDNTVVWRKQCGGGDVRSRYQPAYDRYRVTCYGAGSVVLWTKDCDLASAGRFAYSRFIPGLPGTRAVCLQPTP